MLRTPDDRRPGRSDVPQCNLCDFRAVTDSLLHDHAVDVHNLWDADDLDDPEGLYSA
jgi:hypothetical protein